MKVSFHDDHNFCEIVGRTQLLTLEQSSHIRLEHDDDPVVPELRSEGEVFCPKPGAVGWQG